MKSQIDGRPLDGVPSIRVHNGTDYSGTTSRLIRWTEVFILQVCTSEAPKTLCSNYYLTPSSTRRVSRHYLLMSRVRVRSRMGDVYVLVLSPPGALPWTVRRRPALCLLEARRTTQDMCPWNGSGQAGAGDVYVWALRKMTKTKELRSHRRSSLCPRRSRWRLESHARQDLT